jgi:hypothetical protein
VRSACSRDWLYSSQHEPFDRQWLFKLLTVEALNEPTISYEGLCDILEERNPNSQITPHALCERMNSGGAVAFLDAGLERMLKETTRPHTSTMKTASNASPSG